jgi:hypothetical protein
MISKNVVACKPAWMIIEESGDNVYPLLEKNLSGLCLLYL